MPDNDEGAAQFLCLFRPRPAVVHGFRIQTVEATPWPRPPNSTICLRALS